MALSILNPGKNLGNQNGYIRDGAGCNMTVADNNYLPNVAKVCNSPKKLLPNKRMASACLLVSGCTILLNVKLTANGLTDLKSRGLIRTDFIDAAHKHFQEHAGYHGTLIWVFI